MFSILERGTGSRPCGRALCWERRQAPGGKEASGGSEVGRQRRFGRETVYVRKGWVAPQTDQIRLLWGGGNHGSRLMCSF